jgi:hypothetical protein
MRDAGYQDRSQLPQKGMPKVKKEGEESPGGSGSSDSSDTDTDEDNDSKQDPPPNHHAAKAIDQTTPSRTEGRICKFFAKTGRCRNGNKCHYMHEVCLAMDTTHVLALTCLMTRSSETTSSNEARTQATVFGLWADDDGRSSIADGRSKQSSIVPVRAALTYPTLQLLEVPIDQTLSNLAQALDFLVNNQFLDGVELNAGEYREARAYGAEMTENLVEVVVQEDRKPGESDGAMVNGNGTGVGDN